MASTQGSYQFPDFNIPDSKKDAKYHKQFVQSITNRSLNSGYNFAYKLLTECYDYYNGHQTDEAYRFLQEAENGDVLPALWKNYNKVKSKVDLLLGELDEKGYDIRVKAINKEAKVRRLEEKEKMRVEMRLQPVALQLEQQVGLPMGYDPNMPSNEEDLDEFFNYSYKETSEIIVEFALKWLAKKNKWDYNRRALFRDILIAGRAAAKVEIVDGLPQIRRIDPRLVVFDPAATDDFLSDSTYFGEVRYMNFADAAAEYGLTTKEIKSVYKQYENYMNEDRVTDVDFEMFGDSIDPFKVQEDGELRVLVVSACWVDTKNYNHKFSTDKYGNEHVKRVDESKDGKEIKKTKIKIWRQGTLIGGKILRAWGEIDNQPRDIDNLTETWAPYKIFIPNYLNGRGVSKVEQLKALQDLKNIVMYNVELAIARSGAKGFIYDISQIPEEWDVLEMIKYLKTVGIAFIDSKKDQLPAQYNQFQTIDLSLSQSVSQFLEISMLLDREMDAISGINEARQGMVQRASQAVGVTQSAILQSNLATASYFKGFEEYCSDLLNHQARMVKIAWEGKERFAPIIGDAGVDFLSNEVDVDLNDYGVFVESIPSVLDDVNKFQEIVIAALQAGQLDMVSAMKLLREKDVTEGLRRFEREMKKKEEEMMQREQQMMQQQAQMQQQATQAQAQAKQMEIDQKGMFDLQKQQLANKGIIDNTKVDNAYDWRKTLREIRAELDKAKIDSAESLKIAKMQKTQKPTTAKK